MECFKNIRKVKVAPEDESSVSDQSEDSTPQPSPGGEEVDEREERESETTSIAQPETQASSEALTTASQKESVFNLTASASKEAFKGEEMSVLPRKVATVSRPSSLSVRSKTMQPLARSFLSHGASSSPDTKSHLYARLSIGAPNTTSSSDNSPSPSFPPRRAHHLPLTSDPDYRDYILEAYGVIPPKGAVPASTPSKSDCNRFEEEYLFKRVRDSPNLEARDWMEVLQEHAEARRRKELAALQRARKAQEEGSDVDSLKGGAQGSVKSSSCSSWGKEGLQGVPLVKEKEQESFQKARKVQEEGSEVDSLEGGAQGSVMSSSTSSWGKEGLEGVPLVSDTSLSVPNLGAADKLTVADVSSCLKKISMNVEVPRMNTDVSEDESPSSEQAKPVSPAVEGTGGGEVEGVASQLGGVAVSPTVEEGGDEGVASQIGSVAVSPAVEGTGGGGGGVASQLGGVASSPEGVAGSSEPVSSTAVRSESIDLL